MDRYGRMVALVRVGGTFVNEELIRQGLAWVFSRSCDRRICEEWKKMEAEARKAKQGLWSLAKPVTPTLMPDEFPAKARPRVRRVQRMRSR